MVPNHLFQLLSLTAMEPTNLLRMPTRCATSRRKFCMPFKFQSEDVCTTAVPRTIRRGVAGGERNDGYRQRARVSPASNTETYVALKARDR